MVVVCPVPRRHGSSKRRNALLSCAPPGTCSSWGDGGPAPFGRRFKHFQENSVAGRVRRTSNTTSYAHTYANLPSHTLPLHIT